ncbi:MAG: AAA family ATPase [Cyanobacteria bacterium REEB67]|nr:AAA family ATPase [Cyanobacteria bacterium REEB67]
MSPGKGHGLLLIPPGESEEKKRYQRLFAEDFAASLEVIVARAVDPASLAERHFDFLFSGRAEDAQLAQTLGCEFIPVDAHGEITCGPPRPPDQRRQKRVCIFGPESTGKSTLATRLAAHFSATLVPEYARGHLSFRPGPMAYNDLALIARGQKASQSVLAQNGADLLICDSDLLTTYIYSTWLYGTCDDWIKTAADDQAGAFDLYLLTDIDVPWVDDDHRVLPEGRQQFFDRCQQELIERGRTYVLIKGDWEKRFNDSAAAVTKLLN